MSSDTEMTGTSMERATRSAVRCRVPVSVVGTLGLGTRWTLARAMRLASGGQDDGPVHLGQLRQALRAELGVEQEATRADPEHLRAVADHDQGAHVGLQDAVEAVPERPPGGDGAERLDHGGAAAFHLHDPTGTAALGSPARPSAGPGAAPRSRPWSRHAGCRRPRRRGRTVPGGARLPGGRPATGRRLRRTAVRHGLHSVRTASPARVLPGLRSGHQRLAEARAGPPRPAVGGSGPPGGPRRPGRPRRSTTRSAPTGRPVAAEARARHTARSAPGSAMRTPPTAETYTSWRRRVSPARRSSTASSRARRPLSNPVADRRGLTIGLGTTRACISTSRGRCPSIDGNTTEPGAADPPVDQEQPARVGHPHEPAAGHLEQAELAGRRRTGA